MKRLLDQLGTFGIVTIVTMLVWLYAEDANIEEYTDQSVRLQFVVPQGSEGLLNPAGTITVKVDFNGSNGQYQQFIDSTRGLAIPIDLTFDPSEDLETINVNIRDQLEQFVFDDMGINLTGVNPETLPVTFEKIVDVYLDVKLVPDTGDIKLSSYQFTNDSSRRIKVIMPAGQARQIENKTATARIRKQDVEGFEKGVQGQTRVPIELPEELAGLAPSLTEVGVIATVANDRATVTLDRRPIRLSYPPSINERYVVDIIESDRFITAFKLEGPREQIELLQQDPASAAVWATVRISNEEADAAAADGGELTKSVEIIAPPGVVLASDVVLVTIKVTPRETPAP